MGLFCVKVYNMFGRKTQTYLNLKKVKTKITFLVLFFSVTIWSQTSSGSGTGTSGGGGTGIKVTISSAVNSSSLEILPDLDDANVIGYKIYNSNFELTKEAVLQPVNRETIIVNDVTSDHYYIYLLLDRAVELRLIISKQFIKE